MFSKFLLFPVFLAMVLSLAGCGEKEPGVGRYGMLDESTPEYTAVRFMRSIYHEDSVDVAISLSTESMARVLKNYHTNRNVQRHVMNLTFDSVEITPEGGSNVGRTEYAQKATITVFFSGMKNEERTEDLRRVDLVKVDGDWKIDRVHPDHFL
ncbi:hypothetical protein DXV75_04725 [Alteromonas aestuariivivens]|uniref:Lipoprotein n=1 Tax=Alteromonas aestuariivivens TaxID=1938339 RepID=A0A3D8MBT7_9ALTE|nr:hypothetical protein [Alteromonas aestuariivivens]RDV27591.1 hypothetical protein DXV75_04725 [Alteromonas aestuariivivens]